MRILIADDDPNVRDLLTLYFVKSGYEVTAVDDGKKAWDILSGDDPPRLAILDRIMPEMDGLALCNRLRKERSEPYVYVILVTSCSTKEDIIKGLDAGADDYLSKPFSMEELHARVRTGVRIVTLQRQLIEMREQLREQATHDPLTGLWNHGAVMKILAMEIARSARMKSPLAVIMADIDHFKQVNDTFGHVTGDAVLVEVGRRIVSSVRTYNAVGRYGGEEFLVVVAGADARSAGLVAERVREVLNAKPFLHEDKEIPLTISLGVAVYARGAQEGEEEVIRFADAALYRAKEMGRNRVETVVNGEDPNPPRPA